MSYKEFREQLQKMLQECLGETEICLHKALKNNGVTKECFLIKRSECDVAPAIYIEQYYRAFLEGSSLQELTEKIRNIYETCSADFKVDKENIFCFEKAKGSIFCKLINQSRNKKLLEETPYVAYLDLAVVFYYELEEKNRNKGSVLIQKEHLALWNIKTEELWQIARENTKNLRKSQLYKINQIMEEMMQEIVFHSEELPFLQEIPMYVLTNEKKYLGANGILFDSILKEAADRIGDFYVLPSSIHECILIPEEDAPEEEELVRMVREINLTQVAAEEVLSDCIYHYDGQKHHLDLCNLFY